MLVGGDKMPKAWTKQTHKKRKQFLQALRETGNVSRACEAAGIGRSTAYQWRDNDPDFAREWDEVIDALVDDLEQEAIRRAKDGSDTLLIFLLKGLKPDRYSDRLRAEIEHSGGINVEIAIPDEVDE